jgi:pimeloyl-ACP methyl ester carboxylesterase
MTKETFRLSATTAVIAGKPYSLHYFDRDRSGPAILYIHGLGCSKADFIEMTSAFELQDFRLLSVDHPGCGESPYDDTNPLNIDGLVTLIETFVDNLGLADFLLVGGSLGGLVGLLYAERHLNRIAGFVNVEGNLAPEDCMFSRNVIPHPYAHFERVIFPQIKKAIAARRGRGFAHHLDVLAKASPRAYYDCAFQTVKYSDEGNLLQRFMSLPIPKCFMYGSENRHLSYLHRMRESGCTVVEIPNASHFLFYDAPDHYAAALASFARGSCFVSERHSSTVSGRIGMFNRL